MLLTDLVDRPLNIRIRRLRFFGVDDIDIMVADYVLLGSWHLIGVKYQYADALTKSLIIG